MLSSGGGDGQGEVSRGSGACGASGSERVALCLPLFVLVVVLLLFVSLAIMLSCPYSDPRVLPFSPSSPPHPSGGRATEQPRGSLLSARVKP